MQAISKDLKTLESIGKHEDDVRLCLAKMFWCEVEEARGVVQRLVTKNEANIKAAEQAEKAVEEAVRMRDNHGTVEDASEVQSMCSLILLLPLSLSYTTYVYTSLHGYNMTINVFCG